jgi:hypothetical protein
MADMPKIKSGLVNCILIIFLGHKNTKKQLILSQQLFQKKLYNFQFVYAIFKSNFPTLSLFFKFENIFAELLQDSTTFATNREII